MIFPTQVPEHEKENRSHRMTAAVEAVRAEEAIPHGRAGAPTSCWKRRCPPPCSPATPGNTCPSWSPPPAAKPATSCHVTLGAWDGRRSRAELMRAEQLTFFFITIIP